MRVLLVTPAPRGSRHGNRVTAIRWARLLRSLGHLVAISQRYNRARPDLLIALHAHRSADSILRFKRLRPDRPLVLCLTGTDLYHDIRTSRRAQRSLELADQLVTLQPMGQDELSPHLHPKVRCIIQSASHTRQATAKKAHTFDVCAVGHLRPVKDPFRAARAALLLPSSSRVRVLQVGGAMSPAMATQASAEEARNPCYLWLGELPHSLARRVMQRSRLLVVSSRVEGGANVVSEALADGVPIIGSHIPGNIGLLGEGYPGYYPVGDTRALARLLLRAEREPAFLEQLREWCAHRALMVRPEVERAAWETLLEELVGVHKGSAPVSPMAV